MHIARKVAWMKQRESLLKLMIQRGFSRYADPYTWVIQGYYCLQLNMNKAREVFDLMRCRRVPPSVVVYNSLLNGYCKDSKIEEAMHLFHHEMLKSVEIRKHDPIQGLSMPIPDGCTYKIVLEALCNNNQLEEAVSLFHSMELEDSYKLNSILIDLYNILLIKGAQKSGKLGIATSLYNEMTITKGLQPIDVTYVAMIEVFCEEGLAGEAKKLLIQMKEKDIWPINCACFLLLIRFLRNKHRDLVEMLLLEMERRGYEIDASAVTDKLSDDGSVLYLTNEC